MRTPKKLSRLGRAILAMDATRAATARPSRELALHIRGALALLPSLPPGTLPSFLPVITPVKRARK